MMRLTKVLLHLDRMLLKISVRTRVRMSPYTRLLTSSAASLLIPNLQLGGRSLTVQSGGLFLSKATICASSLAVIRSGMEFNLTPKRGPRLPLSVEDQFFGTGSIG